VRKKVNRLKNIILIFLATIILGCATGSTIIIGQTRPAIDPSMVRIFLDPPSEFETIGLVEASSDVEFSRQAAQDRVINELRNRAARIGANGVLLVGTGTQAGDTTGFVSGGVLFTTTGTRMTGQGRAIFVIQE